MHNQPKNAEKLESPTTSARKKLFLEHLSQYGIVGLACKFASPGSPTMCKPTFYGMRNSDPEFAKAWDEALQDAEDSILNEMRRRGVEGWDEEVYGSLGTGQGVGLVGTKRVYSDKMLELYARVRSKSVQNALSTNHLRVSGNITAGPALNLESLSPEKRALLEKLLEIEEPVEILSKNVHQIEDAE